MFRSTIYARHERRLLAREAAQRQRQQWQREEEEEQDGSSSAEQQNVVSTEEMSPGSSGAAAAHLYRSSSSFPSGTTTGTIEFSSDTGNTAISYSDEPFITSFVADHDHYPTHATTQSSYTKGSALLFAASAAATSVLALGRTAQGQRPYLYSPFPNASAAASGSIFKATGTTTANAAAAGGKRQVALLAGACLAAGGHCCPISAPFRAGARAGIPVAVKMSVLGAMAFFVGGSYASRVHHQHH